LDDFQVELHDEESGEKLATQIVPASEAGVFVATYQPGQVSRKLSLAVLFNDDHIPGSPFSPVVLGSDGSPATTLLQQLLTSSSCLDYATAASELRHEPLGVEFTVGSSVQLSVHAKNASKGPVVRGGDFFTLSVTTPQGGVLAAPLSDDDTGVYTATPLQLELGVYRCRFSHSISLLC
jgi:hypothetical protein